MMDSLEIHKENNHIDCSNTLLDLISSEINDSENYSLGLSGGSTPKFFYELFCKAIRALEFRQSEPTRGFELF